MAKTIIVSGQIYEETGERTVIVKGRVYEETTAAAAANDTIKAYSLPKIAHPDFSIPGRKPVGAVEINWSDPLSRGLTRCLLFNGKEAHDIVSSTALPKHTASGNTPVYGATDRGMGLDVGGPASNEHEALDLIPSAFRNAAIGSAWSTATLVRVNSISTRGMVFQYNTNTGSTTAGVLYAESNELRFTQDAWDANYASKAITLGEWYWCITTYSGTAVGNVNIYVNGEKGTGATETSTGSDTTGIFFGEGFGGGFSRELDGEILAHYVWTRELREVEAGALSLDPYQILKPAIPLNYFIPAAGGGATVPAGTLSLLGVGI